MLVFQLVPVVVAEVAAQPQAEDLQRALSCEEDEEDVVLLV